MKIAASFLFFVSAYTFAENSFRPDPKLPQGLEGVGITEKLGESIDLTQTFVNEQGVSVPLSSFFHAKKPVILTLVYYSCPNLCNFLLNGFLEGLKKLRWDVGDQFQIVTVSIDSKEKSDLARAKKEKYLAEYARSNAEAGWHFLTGEENQIKKLANSVGFGYRYDKRDQQFAHSAAVFVLTPEGKLSRILYGIEFSEKDLKLSLLEAANGRVGTVMDRVIFFCYHYDPSKRGYSLYVTRLVQLGSLLTVFIVGAYLLVFWIRERKRVKGA